MAYVRTTKRENPFVQLDKEFIGTGDMSLKATGLLTYILSKPDGWQIRMKDIEKRFTDGADSIRTSMNELVKNGYVNKYRERKENGTFGDYVYEVYERPEFNPEWENPIQDESPKRDFPKQDKPVREKPVQENPVYSNNDLSDIDFNNINLSNIKQYLSIKLSETNLNLFVQKRLMKKDMIDRLMLHSENLSINLEKILQSIDDLYNDFKELLTVEQFTSCLVDSLNGNIAKNPKEYVRSSLNKKIDAMHTKKAKAPETAKKSKLDNPEWFNKQKQERAKKAKTEQNKQDSDVDAAKLLNDFIAKKEVSSNG
ncbi:hypothetical protein [Amphibacillus jilinensis]|uniref:hypothetical protein n=1 Tax=Amphibacillus jilinensis TaxID=1216008 RepID=UPI0002FD9471|nr:hypothetical protein [Amphibacillus jilinensis]